MSKSLSKKLDTIEKSLEPQIYKVKHLINGKINSIYVFNGKQDKKSKENEENEEKLFKEIFSKEELTQISKDKIQVKFSSQKIHFDDSIGTIKIKILYELKKEISLDEIYLFCKKVETFNAVSIYQSLTQNKKIILTKVRLDQFISNISEDENRDSFLQPEDKEIYTFEDIFNMKIDNKKYIVDKVLGQKFFIVENEYPFVCNPYNITEYDSFFEKSARKSLSTLNNHLLLNSGEIIDNSIYLCLAEDVLQFVKEKGDVSEEITTKIYYPFLYNKNINGLEDLERMKGKLIEGNHKILNEKTLETFKSIDMFYDVYNLRKSELNYITKGIKYIKAVIKPDFDIKIPLEIIFKIVHATESSPLIKYNPSSRQENVYRLFTDKIATDGRKIPYLKKAIIFKLIKTIGRSKSVSVYVESTNDKEEQNLICEFDEEGFITITSEFKQVINLNQIDELFRQSINPIINEIKVVLEQSGYKLNQFHSLNDENIEIKQLTYETKIMITKPLDIKMYRGCVSSIFIDETNKFKGNTTILRYKRVSNYSKFNSQEAFILEKSNQGLRGNEIIDALLENFPEDINRKEAGEMVMKIANELEIERGVRKTDIKIKNNPGFKTTIQLERETGIITIVTENINNINYLYTLPIYLDTIVRLTQDKKSTEYSLKELTQLCSTGEKEDILLEEIISPNEESVAEYEEATLESGDEEVEYQKFKTVDIAKPKGALSLFMDEDEEEEEELDLEGGQGTSSSEKSIESEKSVESEKSIESEKSLKYGTVTVPSGLSSSKESSSLESFGVSSSDPSVEEPSVESVEEPSVESVEEPSVESVEEPSVESVKEASVESIKEPSVESVKEPSVESVKEASVESIKEPSVETEKENIQIESEDEESEGEGEKDESEEDEETVRNIDGMKLKKPYYFQTLIEKKDPILILKEDTPQFNSYPRTCSSNMRRQPVILTDSQLDKINKDHPGFLREEDVIKYGSDKDKQFNYICPRYWCLKNNTIVKPSELKEVKGKDGKTELIHPTCGKVLPKGEKSVKPGYYIYEFYTPKPGNKNSKKYPSLIPDKHPDGLCLPCCFDKYNTEGRITAMKKCYKKETSDEDQEKKYKKKEEEDEYIKGPDKFPLESGRWGYLPVEIQIMLHEVNADCQISKTNTNIKENHPCLLRHGVEVDKKQSFVACISDVIFYAKKNIDKDGNIISSKILNVKEMRTRIIKSITIDSFITYQNGNLVTDFYDPHKEVAIEKYKDTKLYAKLHTDSKPEDKSYFTKVISAFENFTRFLNDDDAIIDHTYLWDIISMPNKYLFPSGVNLVIFQLNNDDITNNVSLLCPTNHYSSEFYEARKPTIIIVKEEEFYEPIYSYTNSNKNISIVKEFKEYDPKLSKTMRAIFKEIIKPFFNLICRPLESMPTIYKAKRPILLYDLIQKLDNYDYTVTKLVVNFSNKVIGVIAEEPGVSNKSGFVPCYPSAIDDNLKSDLDYVFMTDVTLWNTYVDTIQFLNKLDKRSKKRRNESDIPCKPAFKVIEEDHIVGILTNTNQFIQLSQPIRIDEVRSDVDIPSLNNENYIVNSKAKPMIASDVEIATQHDVDKERVDYIKRIKLETNFYNVFRNTIRILINDYENATVREKIENEMKKEYIIYSEKLKTIHMYLRELVKDKIQFIGDENYYKLINDVTTCVVKNKDQCSSTPNLCVVTENDGCNLILPTKNLITKKDNEPIYYSRMADEFIRYNRIKSFMLDPQTYLSFGNINYNLNENEIILIQSLLSQEYFETLVPAVINKYVKYNSYDEVQPIITQVYDNLIPSLDQAIGKKNNVNCDIINKQHITSTLWRECFPESYKEMEYSKFNYCTFKFIIELINKKTSTVLTINEVKRELYEEYQKYLPEYTDKIIDILIIEGKKTLGDQVHSGALNFLNFIYTDSYFLTPFDLWMLVTKYKIPTIFISQKWILQTEYKKQDFVAYGDINDDFAFVVLPGLRNENIPNYKIIQSDKEEVFISLEKLSVECNENILESIRNKITIEDYLKKFKKPLKTKYEKKKPIVILSESESEDIQVKPKRKRIVKLVSPVVEEKGNKSKKNVDKKSTAVTKRNIKSKITIASSTSEND